MKDTRSHPLRKARLGLARPLTQQQLADFAQVSLSTIERAERGEPIRIDSIQRICDYFDTDAQTLGLRSEDGGEMPEGTKAPDLSPPTRFLTMGPEELLKRYSSERDNVLELKIETINWTIPEVVVVDNSRWHLPLSAITVQLDESYPEYMIPAKIAGKAEDILEEIGHYFYDSTTIRLNGIQHTESDLTLLVAKAHFMQYIATNYAMDALLTEKGWTRSLRDAQR